MCRRWGVAGPTCRRSALCVVVGLSLACTRRCWAYLSVVTWPVLVVVGGPICRRRVAVRGQGLLIVIGMSPDPASGHIIGLSYSSSLGLRSFILASFMWPWLGWAGRVLFDVLVLGETLALSI